MLTNIIIEQIIAIYILAFIGFVLYKNKTLTETTIKNLTTFLLKYVTIFIILNSILTTLNETTSRDFFLAFVLALVLTIIYIIVTLLIFKKRKPLISFSTVFTNASFMGIPLVSATLGPKGILYLVPFIVVQVIATWTFGIWLFNDEKADAKKTIIMIINNPAIVGLTLSLLIYFSGLKLPAPIADSIKILASLNTPLAMLILGSFIAKIKIHHLNNIKEIIIANLFRSLIIPAITLIFFYFFNDIDKTLITTFIIAESAPIAISTSMFALKYNKNTEFASALIMISTSLSIITIPSVIFIAKTLGII